jgi:hypothetical protein
MFSAIAGADMTATAADVASKAAMILVISDPPNCGFFDRLARMPTPPPTATALHRPLTGYGY